jgi:hypothetical protein
MKNSYLFRFFFKNAIYSLLFWVAMFVVLYEFMSSFVMKLDTLNQRMVVEQLYFNLYLVGLFLAPALGIVAGRALVNKESQILLVHQVSRRAFYLSSFLFYALVLLAAWLVMVAAYLLTNHYYNQPISQDDAIKLLLSFFALLLPFLWAGFVAMNFRQATSIILYLFLFLVLPRVVTQIDKPDNTTAGLILTSAIKGLTVAVPKTQPYQLIASSFSNASAGGLTNLDWLGYGLLWAVFLILSGFLVFRRKDLIDPHHN